MSAVINIAVDLEPRKLELVYGQLLPLMRDGSYVINGGITGLHFPRRLQQFILKAIAVTNLKGAGTLSFSSSTSQLAFSCHATLYGNLAKRVSIRKEVPL